MVSTESEVVAELFKLYEKKIQELAQQEAKAIAEKKEQKKEKARKSAGAKKTDLNVEKENS